MSDAADRRDALPGLLRRAVSAARERDPEALLEQSLERVQALRALGPEPGAHAALDRVADLAHMSLDADWVSPPSVRLQVLGALDHFVRATRGGRDRARASAPTALAELVADALQLELEGYRELRSFRERATPGSDEGTRRLEARRKRIRARIQRQLALDSEDEPDPRRRFRHWRSPL